MKPRRAVKVGLVSSLLVAAALVLSGCGINVYDDGGGVRNLTITKDTSASIIWNCTVEKGTGQPRAFCALDTVRNLCLAFPVKGIDETDCILMGNYGDWQDMNEAILDVIGPNEDCLSFVEYSDSSKDYWYGIPKGYRGCQ